MSIADSFCTREKMSFTQTVTMQPVSLLSFISELVVSSKVLQLRHLTTDLSISKCCYSSDEDSISG